MHKRVAVGYGSCLTSRSSNEVRAVDNHLGDGVLTVRNHGDHGTVAEPRFLTNVLPSGDRTTVHPSAI